MATIIFIIGALGFLFSTWLLENLFKPKSIAFIRHVILLYVSLLLMFCSTIFIIQEQTYKKALKYNPYEYGYIYTTKDSTNIIIDSLIFEK